MDYLNAPGFFSIPQHVVEPFKRNTLLSRNFDNLRDIFSFNGLNNDGAFVIIQIVLQECHRDTVFIRFHLKIMGNHDEKRKHIEVRR